MEGISMNTLQMDPYWNQYWQQSMLMNSMYQGGASSQTGVPQTGTGTTNPSFQANPNGASATTNIQSMQEETPKKVEKIEKPVEKWLCDVENLLKEVGDLEQRITAERSCFQGRFLTLGRYRLC